MKILLACSAGMSTALLEKSIKDYVVANNIEADVKAQVVEKAKEEINEWDVVLLGPQVKFMLSEFEALSHGVPVAVIPTQHFALANGEEVYKFAQTLKK